VDHSDDAKITAVMQDLMPGAIRHQIRVSRILNPDQKISTCDGLFCVVCIYLAPHMGLGLYLSINTYLSISISICINIYLSTNLSIYLSLYLSLSISISIYLYLSISIYIYLKPYFPGSKKQSQEKGFGTPINFETPIQGKYIFLYLSISIYLI
jgi:hypothetical protein